MTVGFHCGTPHPRPQGEHLGQHQLARETVHCRKSDRLPSQRAFCAQGIKTHSHSFLLHPLLQGRPWPRANRPFWLLCLKFRHSFSVSVVKQLLTLPNCPQKMKEKLPLVCGLEAGVRLRESWCLGGLPRLSHEDFISGAWPSVSLKSTGLAYVKCQKLSQLTPASDRTHTVLARGHCPDTLRNHSPIGSPREKE